MTVVVVVVVVVVLVVVEVAVVVEMGRVEVVELLDVVEVVGKPVVTTGGAGVIRGHSDLPSRKPTLPAIQHDVEGCKVGRRQGVD